MNQDTNQEEENTQQPVPFQPFTNIAVSPDGAVFTHYLAPGLCIGYALGPAGVAHIRDQWNMIEAQQHEQQNMPKPPLGLILPMSRVD